MIQPKPFLNNFKLRNKSYGIERRRDLSKIILENGTPFPKPITYKDIDLSFYDWVNNSLSISYEGKKLPTFKLYSNQRINEYAQTWNHLDESGNLLMNFKVITRDNNPKKGTNQGEFYNIPGNRDYTMFAIPVLQENGSEAYDIYSMKQPFCVDFEYTVILVTNKYDLLNLMNETVNNEFKSITQYINVNGHYIPMNLEDISDESEYNLDDRKYYSQSYKIKVKAYIIREEDFKVTKVPSRFKISLIGDRIKEKKYVYVEDENRYEGRYTTLHIKFPICVDNVKFKIDTDLDVEDIELTNLSIEYINFYINDELIITNGNVPDSISIINGDEIKVDIIHDNIDKESEIILKGRNPNVVIDKDYNPESSLDEIPNQEEIIYEG